MASKELAGSALPKSPSKEAASRPSGLEVKAQQGGGKQNDSVKPISELFHEKVALFQKPSYVRHLVTPTTPVSIEAVNVPTPWGASEDDHEIRMWFEMPGIAAENIEVEVVDNLLVIKGEGVIDGFSPYDSRVLLTSPCWKEEITSVLKNGVLYITVPKITKFEHKIIHIPVRSA